MMIIQSVNQKYKKEIQYIRAKERGGDYCFDGIKESGYDIIIPFRDYNIVLRLIREAWFRLRLPFRRIWYNPKINRIKAKTIIVKDPLITVDFLVYLRRLYPKKRIIFEYDNKVKISKKTGLDLSKLPSGIVELWSYDLDDCKKYGMRKKADHYLDIYKTDNNIEHHYKYDILYLGRDKGRAKLILKLEDYFRKNGLKTNFHICADRCMFAVKKKFYKKKIKYREYLELQKQSRAILNIMPKGQYSITPRDMEAAFNNVKEITNNRGVFNLEFYSKDRYFVLGVDDIKQLKDFLNKPLKPIDMNILNNYTFDSMVNNMLSRGNISEEYSKKHVKNEKRE